MRLAGGSQENDVRTHRALGNGGTDLVDENADCDDHKWKKKRNQNAVMNSPAREFTVAFPVPRA